MLQQAWTGDDAAAARGIGEAGGVAGFSEAGSSTKAGFRRIGDEAVEAAFREHSAAVYGTALRSTRDPDVAADVMQEAFVRLVLEVRAGRCPDHVGGWLHRTSANLIVSRARRADVERRYAPRLVRLDTPAEPDEIAIGREQRAELTAALSRLSATDRSALLMEAQGASGTEIAAHLGRSAGATRTALCRARQRLRVAAAAEAVGGVA